MLSHTLTLPIIHDLSSLDRQAPRETRLRHQPSYELQDVIKISLSYYVMTSNL